MSETQGNVASNASSADGDQTKVRWILGQDACEKLKKESTLEGIDISLLSMKEDAAKEDGGMTDMVFVLDSGRRIRGHKQRLMFRCEYIRVMMSSGMEESKTGVVHVRECSDGAFLALHDFLYTGRLGDACLEQDWEEFWELADLFGLHQMQTDLLEAVTFENVAEEAAIVAARRGLHELIEKCAKALPSKPPSDNDARRVIRVMDLLSGCTQGDDWQLPGSGIGAIVGAMEHLNSLNLKGDREVEAMRCGCIALRKAACSSIENREQVARAHGAEAVVTAMDKHQFDAHVQEDGCGALRYLDVNREQWNFKDVHANNITSKACCAILRAIKAYGENSQLTAKGCQALCTLSNIFSTVFGEDGQTEKWISPFDDWRRFNDFFSTIEDAIGRHINVAEVQEAGCELLWLLGVKTTKGEKVVLEAVKAHRTNDRVQEMGSAYLALEARK